MTAQVRTAVDLISGKTRTWQLIVLWKGEISDHQLAIYASRASMSQVGTKAVNVMQGNRISPPGKQLYSGQLVEATSEEAALLGAQLAKMFAPEP